MSLAVKSLVRLPLISETIAYLEKLHRGEPPGKDSKARQIEELYFSSEELLGNFLRMVEAWGDGLALRQILFFHYLHSETLVQEIVFNCIYPRLIEKRYYWRESDIRFYLQQCGVQESEISKAVKVLEKVLGEAKLLSTTEGMRYVEYQRPTVETIAYALYVEYGEGFAQGQRFALKNPPLSQILEHALFPAYLLLDPRSVHLMLEACRMKNYISLEARGGLCQYALIYQDLSGLVEYMVEGGHA